MKHTLHVMVDIETMSNQNDAAIMSIGACFFTEGGGVVDHLDFYQNVDLASSLNQGLHFSAETFYWWAKNKPSSIQGLCSNRLPLENALEKFNRFLSTENHKFEGIWANSPTFDLAILNNAYKTVGLKPAWKFYQERDVRTVASFQPRVKDSHSSAVTHNALDDCKAQVAYVCQIMQNKGIW